MVLSPVRWTSFWRRPHHIVSRLASGRRTWFVEESLPVPCLSGPQLRTEQHGDVCRVWLEVPADEHGRPTEPWGRSYDARLLALLGVHGTRTVLLYTPAALALAQTLAPTTLVYDVMVDAAAPPLRMRHRQALRCADVVFTGGRSLHRSVVRQRPERTHCFPDGVDPDHYAPAAELRRRGGRPVAGFVGVIDERVDLELVADLAHVLRDWRICMVGPVANIDLATLPRSRNITYPGPLTYADLPEVMAGFDVALMPFAVHAAIAASPLDYLAAGLPVVSTGVPEVITDFGGVVEIQDDAAGFAGACRRLVRDRPEVQAATVDQTLHWNHWDAIAERMEQLILGCARDDASVGAV